MTRILLGAGIALFLTFGAAQAADNSQLPVCTGVTTGNCTNKETFANKDISGVKFPKHIPTDGTGAELFTSGNAGYMRAAAGAVASGAVVDLGAQADSACGTDNGTCSLIALLKRNNQLLTGGTITAGTAGAASSNVLTVQGIASMTPFLTTTTLAAGTAYFGKARLTDGSYDNVLNPCQVVDQLRTPISISAAASSVIVTGTPSKRTFICGMMLIADGTTDVGIVQGSGSLCASSTLGLIGGASAATGIPLTAQAGFVIPVSPYAAANTTVNANDICLINGSAVQVSGFIVTATP